MVRTFAKVVAGAAAVGYFALGGFLAWLFNDNINDSVEGRMAAYAEEHSAEAYEDPEKVAIVARICVKLYVAILMPAKLIWHGIKYSLKKCIERC